MAFNLRNPVRSANIIHSDEQARRHHRNGSRQSERHREGGVLPGGARRQEWRGRDYALRCHRPAGAHRGRSAGFRRTGLGGRARAQACIAIGADGNCRLHRSARRRRPRSRRHEQGRQATRGRDPGHRWRRAGLFRAPVPAVAEWARGGSELFAIPSGTIGTMSSEISMRFGFRGLSHVVSTGCTSSTDALAYAMREIRAGGLPMMLAGGVDTPIALGIVKGFLLMRILTRSWNHAPERGSRPFSADRDGFVLGEGAWMFVLEDYAHARARGAGIYAEVAGYGSTCEAFHRVRLEECGEEPARAMELAMRDAGIGPADVQYVNLHGTSTVLNDRIETRALKLALGMRGAYNVPTSALKSQIGHPQGACGAAGVAATLVAMKHGQVPPTINLDSPDPECDLDYVPEPGRRAQIEHAICNCIAFGSKNSALVLRRV